MGDNNLKRQNDLPKSHRKAIETLYLNPVKHSSLVRAMKFLKEDIRIPKKVRGSGRVLPVPVSIKSCEKEHEKTTRVDNQVKLYARQLSHIAKQLRKSILRHDWNEIAHLLAILCHPGLKTYYAIMLRTCYLVLFNHPKSNKQLLKDFVHLTTGYILDEDIEKFIRILFTLRTVALPPPKRGQYKRLCHENKITNQAEYKIL